MRFLFDHLGMRASDTKLLLVEAPADTDWSTLDVVEAATGTPVRSVQPRVAGSVAGWSMGPWWSLDISELDQPGRYAVRWATPTAAGRSEAFEVVADTDDRTDVVSDIVHYIKGQRCSGIWDAADRRAPRAGDASTRRDVHGGWYDASGDHSKYLSHLSYTNFMNPQQAPLTVWVLGRVWHALRARGAAPLLVERIRDEALHGADWLLRMLDDEGFWYMTVFDRWTKDPAERVLCSYRTQQGHIGDDYQAGWRQGGGMASAALALASTLGDGTGHAAHDYLDAALVGFEHLQRHGLAYLDDGRENVIDDTCALLAACELISAGVDRPHVVAELDSRVDRLLAKCRVTDGHTWLAADDEGRRSWFHASDEGLPGLAMLAAATRVDEARSARLRRAAADLLASQVRLGARVDNPFGYPPHWISTEGGPGQVQWFFPHDNPSGYWWQGENARLASLAAFARAWIADQGNIELDPEPDVERSADHWCAWITGRNPFDACMLEGRGRNNPPYEPDFPNAPGGVCNGVTSGFDDESDIALRPMPHAEDRTQSWRWGEQWMPHATWLLYATVLQG